VPKLEEIIKEMGLEVDSIHELTSRELEILKYYLDNDETLRREAAISRLRNRQ
jgi:hypothetical protein